MGNGNTRGVGGCTDVVRIVHAGGRVEEYRRPISAAEIMLLHPRHYVTTPDFFRSSTTVLGPEVVLMPGNKFFLVPFHTAYRKLRTRQEDTAAAALVHADTDNSSVRPPSVSVRVSSTGLKTASPASRTTARTVIPRKGSPKRTLDHHIGHPKPLLHTEKVARERRPLKEHNRTTLLSKLGQSSELSPECSTWSRNCLEECRQTQVVSTHLRPSGPAAVYGNETLSRDASEHYPTRLDVHSRNLRKRTSADNKMVHSQETNNKHTALTAYVHKDLELGELQAKQRLNQTTGRRDSVHNKIISSQDTGSDKHTGDAACEMQNPQERLNQKMKRASVHNRIIHSQETTTKHAKKELVSWEPQPQEILNQKGGIIVTNRVGHIKHQSMNREAAGDQMGLVATQITDPEVGLMALALKEHHPKRLKLIDHLLDSPPMHQAPRPSDQTEFGSNLRGLGKLHHSPREPRTRVEYLALQSNASRIRRSPRQHRESRIQSPLRAIRRHPSHSPSSRSPSSCSSPEDLFLLQPVYRIRPHRLRRRHIPNWKPRLEPLIECSP